MEEERTKTKHLGRKQENSLIENLFHQAQNKVRTPETGSVKEQQINYKLEMKPSTITYINSSSENPGDRWAGGERGSQKERDPGVVMSPPPFSSPTQSLLKLNNRVL